MDSKELATIIENNVNVMGSGEKMRETAMNLTYMHRTLQQSFISNFIIPFIKKCAENYGGGNYDARNEVALKFMNEAFGGIVTNHPELQDCNFNFQLPLI